MTTVDKVQGLESGADGYITQPVEPPVLVATVNAFLRARTRGRGPARQSEAKFKAVFEQALNGIALVSEDLRYIDVNPAVCRTLGRACEDHLGQSDRRCSSRTGRADRSPRSATRWMRPANGAVSCR